MKSQPSDSVSSTAREILAYLVEHPEAQDTVLGIARWWLLRRCIEDQLPLVRDALGHLVEEGFLIKRGASGDRARFKVNRDRLSEARQLLSGDQS